MSGSNCTRCMTGDSHEPTIDFTFWKTSAAQPASETQKLTSMLLSLRWHDPKGGFLSRLGAQHMAMMGHAPWGHNTWACWDMCHGGTTHGYDGTCALGAQHMGMMGHATELSSTTCRQHVPEKKCVNLSICPCFWRQNPS